MGVVSWCGLLQACRGEKFDHGVDSESTDGCDTAPVDDKVAQELMEKQVREREGEKMEEEFCLSAQFDRVIEKAVNDDETDGGGYSREVLPTEADFVLAYATVPG